MRLRSIFKWSLAFTILPLVVLLISHPALSQGGGKIDLSKISIPEKHGNIKDYYQAPSLKRKKTKLIFHIQDIHVNYEAQKNLANILEYLIETYGLSVILVEGGITDKDFSYIRDWAPIEERRKKADQLMKEGVISGETYVDIASDYPLKFQGIEEQRLYEKNMEIYLEVEKFRPDVLNIIEGFKKCADKLKRYIYTSRLKKFDKEMSRYAAEKIELTKYIEFLDEIAVKEALDLTSFINFTLLLETSRMEKRINFKKAEAERDRFVRECSKSSEKESIEKLILMSVRHKQGDLSAGEFYGYLRELRIKKDIDLKGYKNLDMYTDYIAKYERLDKERFYTELKRVEAEIARALCKNDEQRELYMISKNIGLIERLTVLKLSPEDFLYLQKNKKEFDFQGWSTYIDKNLTRFRVNLKLPKDLSPMTNNLKTMEAFYKISYERDDAFLRNSLKKMEKENEDMAVLIAGGYHTKNLTRLFVKNGISYLVITPYLSKKTDERLYDKILKESYETRIWKKE